MNSMTRFSRFTWLRQKFGKKLAKLLLLVLILSTIGVAGFFYLKYQDALNKPSADIAAEKLVEEIGKVVELPADEIPLIATVEDRTELYDKPFFAKAQNGDKVLVYNNAKKAYLYRPSTKKIINIGPVNFPTPTKAKTTPTPSEEEEEISPSPSPKPIKILLSPTGKVSPAESSPT